MLKLKQPCRYPVINHASLPFLTLHCLYSLFLFPPLFLVFIFASWFVSVCWFHPARDGTGQHVWGASFLPTRHLKPENAWRKFQTLIRHLLLLCPFPPYLPTWHAAFNYFCDINICWSFAQLILPFSTDFLFFSVFPVLLVDLVLFKRVLPNCTL